MTKRALAALRKSINEKWKLIPLGKAVDQGDDNCALCAEFYWGKDGMTPCGGCPVRARTQQPDCRNTPLGAWDRHQRRDHRRGRADFSVEPGCETCVELSRAELEFLRSLLPKLRRKT